jgi:glycosyltransferase involved in cell wall biosynthesis
VDITYARSTPLTVGIPAILAKKLRKIPFIFEVTDQWPQIPIEMGILRNKIVIKTALWLEKTIYKNSQAIIACSPGMVEGVQEVLRDSKFDEKPISMIPNFSETGFYRPDIDGSGVRRQNGWADKLVLLHAGTMGRANSLDFVIDVAQRLQASKEVLFVLIGDGGEKPALQRKIKQRDLTNVEILPIAPRKQLPAVLAAAEVLMVIFADYPVLQRNSANKFFDALAAGKPVLLNYSGWQREVVEQHNAGFGCRQYDIDEFVEKVSYLNSHRELLVEMSGNARRLAVEKFGKNKLAEQALAVVEECYKTGGMARSSG